jgi:hypothetical protein
MAGDALASLGVAVAGIVYATVREGREAWKLTRAAERCGAAHPCPGLVHVLTRFCHRSVSAA